MNIAIFIFSACLFTTTAFADSAMTAALRATALQCEYLTNPRGIYTTHPRLSWILTSKEQSQRQTAYQILVADSPAKLAKDQGDLWDSGKVKSDHTLHIAYAGHLLQATDQCFWKVRVWDAQGQAGDWSKPARWSVGLLKPEQWKGTWIGWPHESNAQAGISLAQADWIWQKPQDGKTFDAPAGTCWFRRVFQLSANDKIAAALAMFTADNDLTLYVNGHKLLHNADWKHVDTADIQGALRPGQNVVAAEVKNLGNKPNPAGLLGCIQLQFHSGKVLTLNTGEQWLLTSTKPAQKWNEIEFNPSGWQSAFAEAPAGQGPWGKVGGNAYSRRLAARYIRHEFAIDKPVVRAAAYVSGLGYSELYINGQKISNDVLSPMYTDYDKHVPYLTFDVTHDLQRGKNALGVILGNGRFYAPRLNVPARTMSYGFPKLLMQIKVWFADGSTKIIASSPSWKLTTQGPIRANNDYDGEIDDARMNIPGWSTASFDDHAWHSAEKVSAPKGTLTAQMMPPMRLTKTLQPVKVTNPKPGIWVYDFGQEITGWCRLHVKAPAGTRVEMRYAEALKSDGTLYTANLRGAKCRDIYITDGNGMEVYHPRFTYRGFRYVALTGYPGKPDAETLEACAVHTDLPLASTFKTSNPLLNRIHENISWGLRDNYLSIPTDCPQRDERQGWTGDRANESKGETFFFKNVTLYSQWLVDMQDSQRPDGVLSDVAPAYWPFYSGNVTWPSTITIIPKTLLTQFDDKKPIEQHYQAMVRWLDYFKPYIHNGILARDSYGDWCAPPRRPNVIHTHNPALLTSKPVLATTYYIHNLRLVAGYAQMLGHLQQAKQFRQLAETMTAAFNKKFLNTETGIYDNGSQTAQVLPLAFNITPTDMRHKVFQQLVDNIENKSHGHIGTGLIGGQWIYQTLTRYGRADLAYQMLNTTTYPSFGYMIKHGATTIWELWNGNTANPAMNSRNHLMLVGDAGTWMYESLAGIESDPAYPGFKHIIMNPHPVDGIEWVDVTYHSVRGDIHSHWTHQNHLFTWHIGIPPNTTATAYLPTTAPVDITVNGKSLSDAGLKAELDDRAHHRTLVNLPAGQYDFTVTSSRD